MASRVRNFLLASVMAGVLAGCVATEMDTRHLEPIPPRLVSQMAASGMSPADPILIRIYKQESELEIWKRDTTGRFALLKTYPMCRWSGKLGPKTAKGDRQAPEGFYTITARLMNPKSAYYLAFNLGFPNPLEKALGYEGSALMVHGACSSSGCYAMTDDGVAEIYAVAREAFRGGQRSFQVQALPFRMTADNLAAHRDDPNFAFWQNLKEGADHFDVTRQPPKVGYCGRRYVFDATADDGSNLEPLAPCPALVRDPEIEALVAEKRRADGEAVQVLARAGVTTTTAGYQDGGMHPSFRRILASRGPEALGRMTSGRVKVSRPEAALADPYTID
jgi:murein L,D-transpeptidase YafK